MHCCCVQEHPAVRGRTDDEVAAYRNSRQIHVYGEGVPKPCTTFEEASFPGMQLLGLHTTHAGNVPPGTLQWCRVWVQAVFRVSAVSSTPVAATTWLTCPLPAPMHCHPLPS